MEEISKETFVRKLHNINNYSLDLYSNNRLIEVYAYLNDMDINEIKKHETANLLSFLSNCKCYTISRKDKGDMSFIEGVLS